MVEVLEKEFSLDERAVLAKESSQVMEQLISEFRPFLRSRANKFSSKHAELQDDDLFSVAMMAFYEAIKSYDIIKGHFFPFANRVVYNRIVDSIRKVYRSDTTTISLDIDDDDEMGNNRSTLIEKTSINSYQINVARQQLVEEIEQFQEEIADWGITMAILVEQSPKHLELQKTYKRIVSMILESPEILQTIHIKRYFPVKAVVELTGLPQKKIERARRYIIASIIIKSGDYTLLAEYVDGGR